jgi:hypothetical protein
MLPHVADAGGEPQAFKANEAVPEEIQPHAGTDGCVSSATTIACSGSAAAIYFAAKRGATGGHSFQHPAAVMTGNTHQTTPKMMLQGGRSVEGSRSRSGKEQARFAGAAGAGKKSVRAKGTKAKPAAKASGKKKPAVSKTDLRRSPRQISKSR